jgi:hypothetical protein
VWLGLAAAMNADSWHEAQVPFTACGRPAPWQRAHARLACAPLSGKLDGCENTDADQAAAVTL